MEEETIPSSEYIKGFNDGYLLAKELPDLMDKLSSIESNSDRTQGFKDGQKVYVLEKAKEQRPSWLKERPNIKDKFNSKSKDLDNDIEL